VWSALIATWRICSLSASWSALIAIWDDLRNFARHEVGWLLRCNILGIGFEI
jgi:hypothetical protein